MSVPVISKPIIFLPIKAMAVPCGPKHRLQAVGKFLQAHVDWNGFAILVPVRDQKLDGHLHRAINFRWIVRRAAHPASENDIHRARNPKSGWKKTVVGGVESRRPFIERRLEK